MVVGEVGETVISSCPELGGGLVVKCIWMLMIVYKLFTNTTLHARQKKQKLRLVCQYIRVISITRRTQVKGQLLVTLTQSPHHLKLRKKVFG